MAEIHARRLYAEGIDLDTIRKWLLPVTKRKERDDIIAALSHPAAYAA